MPQVPPPAGTDGLPRISTRAFQLIDWGFSPWSATVIAIEDYFSALVAMFGREIAGAIGEIGA